ncbi:MAG: hypothetical protein HY689_15155 [Chloroflexi bacterium]|nr:hypothetical protein [Chloroflexota bacterium]
MTDTGMKVGRRQALAAGGTALLLSLLRPFGGVAHAQKAVLLAKQVPRVPEDPGDPAWNQTETLEVPLAPQAVVKPRRYEPGVPSVTARALYDGDRVAVRIEWTAQAQNIGLGAVNSFRDAIALEFPADPAGKLPYFAMGEPQNPVTIYQWKADWQHGREYDANEAFPHMVVDWYPLTGRKPGEIAEGSDYGKADGAKVYHTSWSAGNPLGDLALQERTPVEKLQAEGFGTLSTAEQQDGQGKGVWQDGKWNVVISLPRAQERFTFDQGKTVPIAFACWNGTKRERGGEKSISTWYFLALEQPTGVLTYISPVAVAAVAAVAQLVGLRLLRREKDADAQE